MSDESRNGDIPPLWTDDDVAAYLRVSVATVQKWAKNGRIPVRKAGALNRFDRREIEEWTREGRIPDEVDPDPADEPATADRGAA